MTTDTDEKIIASIKKQQKEGDAPLLLEFYHHLLRVQSAAGKEAGAGRPGLGKAALQECLAQGTPLLWAEALPVRVSLLRKSLTDVVFVFRQYPRLFGELPEEWQEVRFARALTRKAVSAWLREKQVPPAWPGDGQAEAVLKNILGATLKPFLKNYARAVADAPGLESWRRRLCPICGSPADFAYLDKERGSRWLVCAQCDTEWPFPRLQCPYCGTQDQQSLAYFSSEDDLYRVYICERCRRYIKAIDLRRAQAEVLLPLERFRTLSLDAQAQEKGYSPY